MTDFGKFFRDATGEDYPPFPYQERLAGMAFDCTPDILHLPTGSGKTEAAVLSLWLWRIYNKESGIPRRLVYCLPMRTLVEQTAKRVKKWLENLGLDGRVDVRVLMGGSEYEINDIRPEKPCVIIGTQDILLSGALNHMYGQNHGVWPVAMGLLNNDSMWIMDEMQIMGPGLPTSVQLDVFRRKLKTFGPRPKSVWMSATLEEKWMNTVDSTEGRSVFRLGDGDRMEELDRRNNAEKKIHRMDLPTKNGKYTGDDARAMLKMHRGGPTIIMVNTVERAQELYKLLRAVMPDGVESILIHSRFRGVDRDSLNERLSKIKSESDIIVVSTQVLEAGVDISARTMVTELAPWPSMVQRFGRCNRRGEVSGGAGIYWIDLDDDSYQPYNVPDAMITTDGMSQSRSMLEKLEGKSASPATLSGMPGGHPQRPIHAVLRRRDVETLFDTSPDVGGSHVDVSRFIRDESLDVHVFWRVSDKRYHPGRHELCGMSLGGMRTFISMKEKAGKCKGYDSDERIWKPIKQNDVFPGMIVKVDPPAGGYDEEMGLYIAGRLKPVSEVDVKRKEPSKWSDVTLCDHTGHVVGEARAILDVLGGPSPYIGSEDADHVITAAIWHDVGKMHRVFQDRIRMNVKNSGSKMWAKSEKRNAGGYAVPGFRHEVASSLAFLAGHDGPEHDLSAYLIMGHHGKVRFVMRGSRHDMGGDSGMLAGIINGETLGDVKQVVHEGVTVPANTVLDTSIRGIGGIRRSWLDRTTTLLERYGPFKLAYLEMILRKADWTASAKEDRGEYGRD